MERVQVNLPGKILFKDTFTIQQTDINAANHMGNERILVFANTIRSKFYTALQLKEGDWENGHGTIVANHTVNYKNEGFLGDEIICEVGVNTITECSFDLILHFIKKNGKTLAILRSGTVYYDYKERKIRPLPECFLKAFQ